MRPFSGAVIKSVPNGPGLWFTSTVNPQTCDQQPRTCVPGLQNFLIKTAALGLAAGTVLLAGAPQAFADAVQYRSGVQAEPSLLSFYPFDGDTAPTGVDRVAPLQNGTLTGAIFSGAAGTVGSQSVQGARVALGPVSDYEFSDGSGTVEMFLYQTATVAFNPCFFAGRDDSQSPAVRYSLHGGTAGNQLFIWNGSVAPSVTTPVSMLNNLVHIAYVFEAGLVTVYFNGAALVTWDAPLGAGLGRSFQIGASGPANQEAWAGRIDEVAIYGEALPASAVAAHYASWRTTNSGASPIITQQPQNLALDDGQTANFSVQLADATGATYRWTRNGMNLAGATNATLTLSPVTLGDNNSIFRCVVYNPFGGTNSSAAILAVRTPPSFIVPPVDTVRYITQSGTMSAVVNGSLPLSLQWFKDGALIPNATNTSLNFAQLDVTNSGAYVLTVTNVFGAITSAPAMLAVVPVVVVNPPGNAVRFVGQSVTFNISAAGVPPLSYQWLKGGSPLAGQTNSTLSLGPLGALDAGAYSVTIVNPYGSTNSASAALTVLDVTTPQEVRTPPPFEWLPQDNGTSADAVVLFNEVMFHAPSGQTNLQWIELQNVMRVDVDISNWRLDAGVNYTFPAGTVIPGGGFVVVAKDIQTFTNATGVTTVFGPFTNNLANGGEHLVLRNHDNRLMDEMSYGDEQPWPEGADGSGATLSKRTPLSASAEPTHWVASPQLGGTPGRANFPFIATPSLAINELDPVTNANFRVELFNRGPSALALGNFTLSSTSTNGATNFPLPVATLNPGQFVVFDSAQTGFQPAQNDKLFLLTSNATVLVDAASVKNQWRSRSPDGLGRWMRPTAASFGASNVVAINRDIVINEIMYEAAPSYPSNNYVGSEEEWVELFNRGTNPVNLAGWSLDHGVRYDFPTNTVLAPGAYLVVARDAAAMQAAHPGVIVLGNYSGGLARKTDLIELKDAGQRVVSEVRYYSDGRWPAFAAGGGSSLELVDTYADGRRAESWAASDETTRSSWETIAYRGVATSNKGYNIGHNIWNEFVLGLLDAGEFLLDDVTVTELPGTGQARQLIQNGTFQGDTVGSSPAAWRMQGTHGAHGRTRVETDPANAGNKVLHVYASGATDFLQNHLETTLKSGASIVPVVAGREYEISYRAKWLGGTPLVNTRLYFKWLQRTTALNVPARGGTPGAINSRRVASAGPTYSALSHTPVVPSAGASVTVSINAYDPQDIAALTLFWRVDGGGWNSTPMSLNSQPSTPNQYTGTIPGQAAATKIQFYVQGRDTVGGTSSFPEEGTHSRALLVFNDGLAAAAPNFNLRFVMTAADTATMYFNTNRMSNDRLGATIIYNESEVFYDVGVRLKGSAFGRNNDTETGLSIDFDSDHRFRGAHSSISIERGGSKREILAKHLLNQAGQGVVAGYDDISHIVTPRAQDAGRCFLSMTRTTDTMLDTQYGSGGTVYNLELLYTPTGTVNGNAEAPKLNFPYVHNSGAPELQDLGDDKEVYRWNFQVRNNRAQDDFSLMMTAAKSFELNGATMDAQLRDVLDVDQWLRCFAMESLVGNDDFYTRLYNHNFRMYQRPDDNRLVALSWDLDRAFNLGATASLWGNVPDAFGGTNRMRKLIEYPPNLRAYYSHLLDLIGRCYNSAYATPWASHYATLIGDNGLNSYPAYIASRGAFVRSQIPSFPAFSITTSNGVDFAANTNLVSLVGNAPLALRYLSVNGRIFDPGWPSVTNWSLQLALPGGTNALVIQALDAKLNVLTNLADTIKIAVNVPVEDPSGKIVINEINYWPSVAGTEFVELLNTSSTTAFDLGGWRLNGASLSFDFATILPPRGYLVLPVDRLALVRTYGLSIPAVTEFSGRLDLDGETLSLIKPASSNSTEVVIDRVRYEPAMPWPVGTNSFGRSLQLIDPTVDNARVSDWSDGSGWRFFSLTTNISSSRLSILFDNLGGDVYLDDLSLVPGSAPGTGVNSIVNGDFESALTPSWNVASVATNTEIVSAISRSGGRSLHYVQVPGTANLTTFYQDVNPAVVTNTIYTLSGWYLPGGPNTNFTIRASTTFQNKPNLRPVGPTPGAVNLIIAQVPGYPALWLNEVLPQNTSGAIDDAGDRDPWLELHNSGSAPVNLDGMFLADNYVNLAQWAFPPNVTIPPGGFLVVWCDGEPGESTASELHTGFRIGAGSGNVALSRTVDGSPQILDYFNYAAVPADYSYGSLPDGQPFYRGTMYRTTPGTTNDGSSAPIVVFINEWMAANNSASGIADPADGDYEDWFELYNPGPNALDIGGHFLTDNLTNKFQFAVPKNGHYVIPPGGHLLVWADGESGQNSTNRADLHVSFSLRAAGEAIGLFAADGTQIDAVTFTNQLDNISMGRSPDGSANIVLLPTSSPRGSNGGVQPPQMPQITRVTFTGGDVVQLTVSTVAGRSYQVEFKDDLSASIWVPLGGQRLANGPSLIVADTTLSGPQRFYRVVLLP